MDYKDRIRKATENFITREETYRIKRKNGSPEDDFIHEKLMPWFDNNNFSMNVVESKSAYSKDRQRYISQHCKTGISDIFGNDQNGHSCYAEAKAPGKRNTLRENQREFLIAKIQTNAFAICVDSVEYIEQTYKHWLSLSPLERIDYLLDQLPKKREQDQTNLFD